MGNREEILASGLLYIANLINIEESEKDWIRKYIDRYLSEYGDPVVIDIREQFELETEGEFDEIALEEWAEQFGHCGISGTTDHAYEIGDYYYSSDAIMDWVRELEGSRGIEQLCKAFVLESLPNLD